MIDQNLNLDPLNLLSVALHTELSRAGIRTALTITHCNRDTIAEYGEMIIFNIYY